MTPSVEDTASDRKHRRRRHERRLERNSEETLSDRERRRARRRERRAKREAERSSASLEKTDTTVTFDSTLDNDAEPEPVHQPPTPQEHADSIFHSSDELKDPPPPTDLYYSPPPPALPTPVKTPYDYLDRYDVESLYQFRQQHGHDDCHTRERSESHRERKERRDRHDHHDHHRDRQHRDAKRRSHHRGTSYRSSTIDHNKIKETYDKYEEHEPRRWSWRKKALIITIPVILIIIIALAVAIAVAKKHSFTYTPSSVKVTNSSAFTNGGASKDANNTDDGIGAGTDKYVYYSGPASDFPSKDDWVSFANMWVANRNVILESCKDLGYGQDDTDDEITDIYTAIQSRALASLVDHRFILAVILQESRGCVRVPTSNNGVRNPGLMQSYNGATFSSYYPAKSILQMVQDGTQGTTSGPGLAQHLNTYGNAYSAARVYNSGSIASNGNLSDGNGATACYVSDIANRLTGWVYADSKCPSSSSS